MFLSTLITVAIMLAYAVPGFLAVKAKLIKGENISAFAVTLLYICQPCLTIYSLNTADYSWGFFRQVLIFFALSLFMQCLMIVVCYFIFRKKGTNDIKYRIGTIACGFGNCGFLGVPLIEALLPDHPEAVLLSVAFLVAMNLIAWTLAPALISGNKKDINLRKAVFNPCTLGLVVGLPLFFLKIKIPTVIADPITLIGKFSAPLCMLIMGMRLATVKPKEMFGSPFQYLTVGIKQIIMPLIGLGIVWFLPLDLFIKQTMFILCATPVASVVLAFAEMLGRGQSSAANMVLLGTLLSIVTIPALMLIIS